MNFYDYLFNLKCYSVLTCKLYAKYANELISFNCDYFAMLKKYENVSNNTKRVIISAIKKYFKFIEDKRYCELELPKKEITVKDFVSFEEFNKLKAYLETKKKIKNLTIIRLLFETGIRSQELLNIKKTDIINQSIIIKGKNKKQRIVYITESLFALLQKINFNDNEYLFSFSYKNLYKKINNLGKKVLHKKISPHMFRRGFATYCSTNKIDIYDICYLMGHENINTTKMYIKKEVQNTYLHLFEKNNN